MATCRRRSRSPRRRRAPRSSRSPAQQGWALSPWRERRRLARVQQGHERVLVGLAAPRAPPADPAAETRLTVSTAETLAVTDWGRGKRAARRLLDVGRALADPAAAGVIRGRAGVAPERGVGDDPRVPRERLVRRDLDREVGAPAGPLVVEVDELVEREACRRGDGAARSASRASRARASTPARGTRHRADCRPASHCSRALSYGTADQDRKRAPNDFRPRRCLNPHDCSRDRGAATTTRGRTAGET